MTESATKKLYLEDAYLTTCEATVLEVIPHPDGRIEVVLDQTIFAPQTTVHPADSGWMIKKRGEHHPAGEIRITDVFPSEARPSHLGNLEGYISPGPVTLKIDWAPRYERMQVHTAGLLLTWALSTQGFTDVLLTHTKTGENRWRAVFHTQNEARELTALQDAVNRLISHKHPIVTEPTQPFGQRKSSIANLIAIPDHETPLRNTGEAWPIQIEKVEINTSAPHTAQIVIEYTRQRAVQKPEPLAPPAQFPAAVEAVRQQFYSDVTRQNGAELQQSYFGKKGLFTELAGDLKSLTKDEKKTAGKLLNDLKQELTVAIASHTQTEAQKTKIDFSLPGLPTGTGHLHPVSQAMNEITRIFQKIGFMRVRYPEVDWEWYPFDALNMPKDHPARDDWETFLIADQYRHPQLGKMVLTPHTSNSQVREMQRLNSTPPIRMINIARCYRRQSDVTHTEMFHQFEGLVIDKGITIQHLKGVIDHFAREFYGPGAKSRIRPFHFQFTEPSFEVDFSCMICNGTGSLGNERCRFCKSGWHEVGGCGMVHPNVLTAGGIDPQEFTGFAFGWGIERSYTLREGLKLDDIRLLYSGELRFLEQF